MWHHKKGTSKRNCKIIQIYFIIGLLDQKIIFVHIKIFFLSSNCIKKVVEFSDVVAITPVSSHYLNWQSYLAKLH